MDIEIERLHQDFGKKLRLIRLSKNLTQQQLAFEAGLNKNYISMIEIGQNSPSLKTLYKISFVLDIDIKDFFN